MTITCTRCNQEKDENDFPLNGDGKGGRRKQCKACMKEINKQWRQANKDRISTYNREKRGKQSTGQITTPVAQPTPTPPTPKIDTPSLELGQEPQTLT